MILLCTKCGTKYIVSDDVFKHKSGATVKCTYCDYSWYHDLNDPANSFCAEINDAYVRNKDQGEVGNSFASSGIGLNGDSKDAIGQTRAEGGSNYATNFKSGFNNANSGFAESESNGATNNTQMHEVGNKTQSNFGINGANSFVPPNNSNFGFNDPNVSKADGFATSVDAKNPSLNEDARKAQANFAVNNSFVPPNNSNVGSNNANVSNVDGCAASVDEKNPLLNEGARKAQANFGVNNSFVPPNNSNVGSNNVPSSVAENALNGATKRSETHEGTNKEQSDFGINNNLSDLQNFVHNVESDLKIPGKAGTIKLIFDVVMFFISKVLSIKQKAQKIFVAITTLVVLLVSLVGFRYDYYETFPFIYKILGLIDPKHLVLENVSYQIFHDDNETDIMLSADIVNKSMFNGVVPNLYILLQDKDGKLLHRVFLRSNNKRVQASQSYKFVTKISKIPDNLGRVIINVVDPLESYFLKINP